ncbi:MAG: ATP-binding protein [Thermoanaerobaculales bacterium]
MMRLRRIEAVRYGGLCNTSIGELGDGLNLVLGRNEAGKSTLTSLVRHILYGFPRRAGNERRYLTPSGDLRSGRLVFADKDLTWVLERTEGAHGGQSVIHGPEGELPGDSFLEPLTRAVSSTVFRTVFGFGLDELSSLGSLEDIQGRLYASTVGLEVNPHDVLDELRDREEALWAPRARTKEIHRLAKDLRKARNDRRSLEEVAEQYRADRERRARAAEQLVAAEIAETEARLQAERSAAVLEEARRLNARISEEGGEAEEQRRAAELSEREAAGVELDEALLERAEAIDRLAARCEVFVAEVGRLREAEGRRREIAGDIRRRMAELGGNWSQEAIEDFSLDLELESRLEEMTERIREARRERDETARRATEARAKHAEALEAAGLSGPIDNAGDLGVRLEAVDRLLALGPAAPGRVGSLAPGLVSAAIAVVIIVVGVALGDLPLLIAGALPGALAVALLIQSWNAGRTKSSPEAASLLPLLDLGKLPSPAELIGIKNSLESCRDLWQTESSLAREAAACERVAKEAAAALEVVWQGWIEWMDETGLRTGSGQPSSVRQTLTQLREVRAKLDALREVEETIDRHRNACDEFIREAVALGAVADGVGADGEFEEVVHGVRSIGGRLAEARMAADRRRRMEAETIRAEERRAEAESRVEALRKELWAVIEKAGVEAGGGLAELEALAARARRRAEEAEKAFDRLLEERATIDGLLERGARESASSRLRLVESGLLERLKEALDTYAVTAVAVGILGEALGVYERDRQPAVIRRAQEIFSAMTDGKYTRLATPFGVFAPSVTDVDSVSKNPGDLSRATAEQLFLALRLSYIENLAGAHPSLPVLMDDVLVNFDDERRRAAVRVIAEFAATRQVLFFTCHPATVEVFAEAAGEHTLLELG